VTEEVPRYQHLGDMISALGSAISVYMGLSAFALVELAEWIVYLLKSLYAKQN
jgi:hypothetical protein